MAENHDYLALEWVKGEIEETLKQAQQSLEAFVENSEDSTRMRFCLTHLHHVHGTLQMVEFYGAALLAEEMENLAQAMLNGTVSRMQDAQEVLMRSLLQLPAYLERVKTGRRDVPVVILPLLNDLRAARGEHLLSETAMFKPDLKAGAAAVPVEKVAPEVVTQLPELLKKIRQLYQFALVGLIRGQDMPTNLGYIAKSLTKLEHIYSDTPMAQLWWVAGALVEGVSRNAIELGTSVKMLLGLLDRQLKHSIENEAGRDEPLPVELLKNLLYYVARCETDSPRIRRVKEAFRLDEALPGEEFVDRERRRMSGPDKDTIVSVIKVLLDEISTVKDTLDIFLRTRERDIKQLKPMIAHLKQVSDTLAVLGLGNPRRVVLEQLDVIGKVIDSPTMPADSTFMDVAGALLYVEATLQGIAAEGGRRGFGDRPAEEEDFHVSPEHVSKARAAVIDESRAGLESVKDAIMEYIGARFDAKHLEAVPDTLASVRGGLIMVPLQYPADLLQSCIQYIRNELIAGRKTPDWRELDTLADAITSVEYYLERLGDDFPGDEDILVIAEEAVATLGYPLSRSEESRVSAPVEAPVVTLEQVTVDEDVPAIEIPELTDSLPVEEAENLATEPADIDFGKMPALEGSDHEGFELEPARDEPLTPAVVAVTHAPVTDMSANASGSASAEAAEEELIDEEVLEIFIEEAGEVLTTINEYLPQWRADVDDEGARAEVRRAFHTLKGSGRLVGAKLLGELAWSVENMINRVIDNTIPANNAVFDITECVTDIMPEMVDAFKDRRAPAANHALLEEAAHAIAKGQQPPAFMTANAGTTSFLGETAHAAQTTPTHASTHDSSAFAVESQHEFEIQAGETDTSDEFHLEDTASAFEDAAQAEAHPDVEDEALADTSFELIEPEDETADLEDGAGGLDPVLVDIFVSEAKSHLQTLGTFLVEADSKVVAFSGDLLRALHTLKGSAHMAGIHAIADLAAPTEKFVKEAHVQGLQADHDIQEFLAAFSEAIYNALDTVALNPDQTLPEAADLLERIDSMRQAKLRHTEDATEASAGARPDKQLVSLFLAEGMDLIVDAGDVLKHWEENPVPGDQLDNLRRELRVLARSASAAQLPEVVALCMALEETYNTASEGLVTPDHAFFQVAHRAHEVLVDMMDRIAVGQPTGSADVIVGELQALLDRAPQVAARIQDATVEPVSAKAEVADEEGFELVMDEDEALAPMGEMDLDADEGDRGFALETVDEFAEDNDLAPESSRDDYAHGFSGGAMLEVDAAHDPELVAIFLEEAADIMESTSNLLQAWMDSPDDLGKVAALQRDLHTLKGGARMSEMSEIGDLAHHLENLYEGLAEGRFHAETALFDILHQCHDRLAEMVDVVTAGQSPKAAPDLITAIDGWMRGERPSASVTAPKAPVVDTIVDAPKVEAPVASVIPMPIKPAVTARAEADAAALEALSGDDIDTEILEVFIDEADELTNGLDTCIHAWLVDRDNREHVAELQRLLHTLKGGARLAGLTHLGNLAHDFETYLTRIDADGVPKDDAIFAEVQARHDVLFEQIERVRKHGGQLIESAEPSTPAVVSQAAGTSAAASAAGMTEAAVPETGFLPPLEQPPAFAAPWHEEEESNRPAAQSESIKVTAEMLEGLVNLAGETSIIRGRIEQEITDFNFVIQEVTQTIDRVRELLRRLDIETEAQILFNLQQTNQNREYEDFDPLEMDRYSALHQLSRSLGESVSDLLDLRDSLSEKARDAETLLVQQARVNSELQEGLMRSRMVPFTRLAPRLRRIVRQVAGEVGKRADLEIIGAEGEMDRTVMDRLVAPLEHMLRNAVDHGIEPPQERVAAGKKEQGRITLHLAREGGEVVLRLTDDGRGIALEKVKKRAVERGLMLPDAPLSDKEVMQFIFRPGFSTAEKVTQISGRGVGMDVVHSEIKQLNGNIKIHSYPGAGSQFTVRLPFTVSVNRALMVRVGDDAYAIPLNNIEGIVRVSPYELDAYYQPGSGEFEYAGSKYRIKYLGAFVHNQKTPNLSGITKPLPVLLVRGTDHAVALQVDSLIGSREIVVKSVGPQLAAVGGISGATILGDGSVVIILDITAMIRAEQAQLSAAKVYQAAASDRRALEVEEEPEANATPVVMVIDDSVTVRKVTTRLLERHGYEVITAKDGVDAITILQENQPDIMLLDIEMPRMDGFEVATLVRHDERLKDTPIIMITSRTGEKHRDRAFSIGVDRYMGKPYQETVLLETIRELLTQRVTAHGQ